MSAPSIRGIDLDGKRVKPGIHFSTGDKIRGKGAAATTYSRNDLVYISGYSGGYPIFSKASSAASLTSRGQLYVLLHDVAVATEKPSLMASQWCVVTGVNTSGGSAGDPVYLSTAGGWSLTAGTIKRQVGRVIVSDANDGVIALDGRTEAGLSLLTGTATITAGQASVAVSVGAAYNGKPVVATVSQAVADGTLTHVVRAVVAAGNLTVYGNANATANTTVSYMVDPR